MADVDDLLSRLATAVGEGAGRGLPLPARFCRAAASVLHCDGAAITLAYTHPERVTLCATDDAALILEEAQDVVGQGPGAETFSTGSYTRGELRDDDAVADARWPLLRSTDLGVLGPVTVHALPLGRPGEVFGVLTLYQHGAGGRIDPADAQALTVVVAAALLAERAESREARGPWAERAEVHQATGMVIAMLGLAEDDALALIRAHAYSHDQSVALSAHEVVTRRLSFSARGAQIEST